MTTILCEECSHLDIKSMLQNGACRLFVNTAPLTFSHVPANPSDAECSFCRFIAECIESQRRVSAPEQSCEPTVGFLEDVKLESCIHGYTQTFSGSPVDSYCVRVKYSDIECRLLPIGEDAYRLGCQKSSFARLLNPTQADRNLLKGCISTCRNLHRGMCLKYDQKYGQGHCNDGMRLIDVVNDCIIKYKDLRQDYVALSYVWGEVEQFLLNRENLEELSEPKALRRYEQRIPNTVKDAIVIARELGFQFLWVDTLCISQNNADEREQQIASMNEIYKHAALTLVALDAQDVASGLHGVRPYVRKRSRTTIQIQGLRLTLLGSPLDSILDSSRWMSRAWTFEENQFSRRVMFFSQQQVYFRCLQSLMTEDTWPEDVAVHRGHDMRVFFNYEGFELSLWKSLLADFSCRQSAFAVDRLHAFQGVLAEISDSYNYSFFCGVPVQDFTEGLLWRTTDGQNTRNPVYPSWSWCGWTGSVQAIENIKRSSRDRIVLFRKRGTDGELVYTSSDVLEDAQGPVQTLASKHRIRSLQHVFEEVDSHASLSCLDFKALQQLSDSTQSTREPYYLQNCKLSVALSEVEPAVSKLKVSTYHGRRGGGGGRMTTTERGGGTDIHLNTFSQARQSRDIAKIMDRNLLYFCGFVANINVHLGSSQSNSDVQVIGPQNVHKVFPNIPPFRLWLDSPSPAGPGDTAELHLLLLKSMTTDRQGSVGITGGTLPHIWEFMKNFKIFKYFTGFCSDSLSCFAEAPKWLHDKLRPEHFSLTYSLCELLLSLMLFPFYLVFLIPTMIGAAFMLILLPLVLLYKVYATSCCNLDMSSVVVSMLVVEPTDDGTYQRVGTAEWEEDAFVACKPDIREIILA